MGIKEWAQSIWQEHGVGGDYSVAALLVAVATMIGAFGGFPEPPAQFLWLTKFPLFQWALVFILIYQGGSGQNPLLALGLTVATFLVYQILKWLEKRRSEKKQNTEPVDEELATMKE